MTKTHLYCPRQRVFVGELLIDAPVLPGQNVLSRETSKFEVDILSINGDKALVLLPNILATKDKNTAWIAIKHLSN